MGYTRVVMLLVILKVIFAQELKFGVLYDSNSKSKYREGILGGLEFAKLLFPSNSLLLEETESTFENNIGGTLNTVCDDLVEEKAISVTVAGEAMAGIISETVQPIITLEHGNDYDKTFNIHPPLSHLNRLFSDSIKFLTWKQFILLYDDSSIYSSLEGFVKDSFVLDWHILPIKADTNNLLSTLKSIKNNKIYNVFLFCADDDLATNILAEAFSEDLISPSYHWVIGNLDVILPREFFVLEKSNLPRLTMFKMHHHSDFEAPEESNSYTFAKRLAFDSILAVAYATKAKLDDDPSGLLAIPDNCGERLGVGSLNEYIKNVDFHGQTGHVTFGPSGQRINYVIDIMNERAIRERKHIAYWDPENGLNLTDGNIVEKIAVTSIISEPFLFRRKEGSQPDGNNNEQFIGLIPDMLKSIFAKLEMDYEIKLVEDGKYGGRDEDSGEWSGMIGELLERKADLAAAALTVTSIRKEVVDFTGTFMNTGIQVLLKKASSTLMGSVNFAVLEPFTADLWLVILVLILCVPLVISTLECISSRVVKSCVATGCEQTIGSSYWFVLTTFSLQGFNGRSPISFGAKVFSLFWFGFVIMVVFTYGLSLSAFMLTRSSKNTITSVEHLANQKPKTINYGTVIGGSTYAFFQKSQITTYSKMWAQMQTSKDGAFVKTPEEGVERVRNGEYAFIGESSLLKYSAGKTPCELILLEDLLNTVDYAFAVNKGSPLGDAVSRIVLKLKETGELDNIIRRWFEDIAECAVDTDVDTGGNEKISTKSFSGAFIMLIFGFIISLFAVLLEWCYFKFIRQKCRETSSCWEVDQTDSNNVLNQNNQQNIEMAEKAKQMSAANKQQEENKLGTPEQQKLLNISGSSK